MSPHPMSPTELQLTVCAANWLRATALLLRAAADDLMADVPADQRTEEP